MTSFELAHETICSLVDRFTRGINHYNSLKYQETEVRQDFIDDFFVALGWDVRHREAKSPKRADYAFYLTPKFNEVRFFAEAKRPSLDLRNEEYYFQTIRYGWNANTPLVILTNFKEFHILDCRRKPDLRYVFTGQHKTYDFNDYLNREKFAEIYWLFSREALLKNSLETYANNLPKPKSKAVQKTLFKGGYQAIDESFLEYIDGLREDMAKAFKKNNEQLNGEELTEAVQRTIDRLVFIRFLEDKLIEPENHVSEWRGWEDFVADCRKLDAKYNGVVFKKHFIDDQAFSGAEEKLFETICSEISNLNSPYDFNYIPIHILGSIYERFLGKVVVSTAKRVHIEVKPEVRKAGGVYYTPNYIVDYIVTNTIGKIIEGKTPKQIEEFRFADIACGSGTFLIGVYEHLLAYHKRYYNEKLKDKKVIDGRSDDFENTSFRDGMWTLTLKLKQNILLNNIFGVDIDAQAVEVTQVSLFLKMLEDETVASTHLRQGSIFSKVLPDLTRNIVCGNSLIGSDIITGHLFSFDQEKKLNPMDYEISFPEIMQKGGFHSIIGNPPYVMLQNLEEKFSFEYTSGHFVSAKYKIDTYQLFIEKAIKLLHPLSYVSFIVPNTFLKNVHAEPLRKYVLKTSSIEEFVIFDYNVFKGASVDTLVFFFRKDADKSEIKIKHAVSPTEIIETNRINQVEFERNARSDFNTEVQHHDKVILSKIETRSDKLRKYCDAYFGIQTHDRKKFVSEIKINDSYKPIIDGTNIDFYCLRPIEEFVHFIPKAIKSGGNADIYEQDRICVRQIGATPIATLVEAGIYALNTVYNIYRTTTTEIDLCFFLGILNSKLNKYYWRINNSDQKGTFPKIKKEAILSIPIPVIDSEERMETRQSIVGNVHRLLQTKQQLNESKTDRDIIFLNSKFTTINTNTDQLIYSLYGLTREEITIVEKE